MYTHLYIYLYIPARECNVHMYVYLSIQYADLRRCRELFTRQVTRVFNFNRLKNIQETHFYSRPVLPLLCTRRILSLFETCPKTSKREINRICLSLAFALVCVCDGANIAATTTTRAVCVEFYLIARFICAFRRLLLRLHEAFY